MASRRVECITFLGSMLLILLRLRGSSDLRSTDSTMWRVSSVGPFRRSVVGIGSACIGPWYEFVYYINLYSHHGPMQALPMPTSVHGMSSCTILTCTHTMD